MRAVESRRLGRPAWMTPFGIEGMGDLFFDRFWPEWRRESGQEWVPCIDLSENDGKYTLTAELPGMKKENISISMEDGYITISGKKENGKEEKDVQYYMQEMRNGAFCRSFKFPEKIDEEKVEATYKDGILTLMIPKKEKEEKKKIKIH
ncbi:MAG: Hsp20/alpha crystallin family protein [Thermodesulfobacteriota bacterium]|nr:Hsp20/alpha crystallin family protein [Thermodesulfobacteriota bacterium]